MQLSFKPDQLNGSGGRPAPVPCELKGLLAPWAEAQCTSYDFGTIIRQVLDTPEYQVHSAIFDFTRPMTLYPTWESSTVALLYIKQGKIISRLKDNEDTILDPFRYSLFHVAAGKYISQPQAGLNESLRIEIRPDFLQELLDAHPQLHQMLNTLHEQDLTGELLSPGRMTGKVKNIIHDIYTCRKSGPSLYLEMKAHIYSLLAAYDEELTLVNDLEHIQASKTEKTIMAIRKFVSGYPHIHECSLESLSKKFNISQSALKVNFKRQCQVSLGDFVQQQCLLKARELLLLGIDPVRDISQQLGYTDVSNFSRAFRNYMGCSPNEVKLHPEKYRGQPY